MFLTCGLSSSLSLRNLCWIAPFFLLSSFQSLCAFFSRNALIIHDLGQEIVHQDISYHDVWLHQLFDSTNMHQPPNMECQETKFVIFSDIIHCTNQIWSVRKLNLSSSVTLPTVPTKYGVSGNSIYFFHAIKLFLLSIRIYKYIYKQELIIGERRVSNAV